MPQTRSTAAKKTVRKGLPVATMRKKEVPIAAGKKQAVQMTRSAVKRASAASAKKTVRKVARAAVRKGISGPTEDSLGITRQEGGRKIQKAVKRLGTEKATKVATKVRLNKGQTYKGGKGWVSAKNKTSKNVKARKSR